jgi:hypothetical protein
LPLTSTSEVKPRPTCSPGRGKGVSWTAGKRRRWRGATAECGKPEAVARFAILGRF